MLLYPSSSFTVLKGWKSNQLKCHSSDVLKMEQQPIQNASWTYQTCKNWSEFTLTSLQPALYIFHFFPTTKKWKWIERELSPEGGNLISFPRTISCFLCFVGDSIPNSSTEIVVLVQLFTKCFCILGLRGKTSTEKPHLPWPEEVFTNLQPSSV